MKNIIKKLIQFILSITMILSLSACTNHDTQSQESNNSPIPEIENVMTSRIIELDDQNDDPTLDLQIKIMFKTSSNLIYYVSTPQADNSYSLVVYNYNLNTDNVEYVGQIDYVGALTNDYVYINGKAYTCMVYDDRDITSVGFKMRIIEIDLINNHISTIYEMPTLSKLAYVEYVDDDKFLVYDTALKSSSGNSNSSVSMFDLTSNTLDTFLTYESDFLKPVVATHSNNLIYILNYHNKDYNIEVYDLESNLLDTIDLSSISYYYNIEDDGILSFQYMEVKNNMVVLTAFGDSSIIFEYDNEKITEKYVGHRLTSWDKANINTNDIKGYTAGLHNYYIDFNNHEVTTFNTPLQHEDSLSFNIYSDNGKDLIVLDTLIDKTKIYQYCNLD